MTGESISIYTKRKNLQTIFNFSWIFIWSQKIKFIHQFLFLKYSWFFILIGWKHFWPYPTKNFQITFYLPWYIKNHIDWSDSSGNITDLKILKFDWLRAFLTTPSFYVSWIYICMLKMKLILHFFSWGIHDLRILPCDRVKPFQGVHSVFLLKFQDISRIKS